jgi:hypothetical protein
VIIGYDGLPLIHVDDTFLYGPIHNKCADALKKINNLKGDSGIFFN